MNFCQHENQPSEKEWVDSLNQIRTFYIGRQLKTYEMEEYCNQFHTHLLYRSIVRHLFRSEYYGSNRIAPEVIMIVKLNNRR